MKGVAYLITALGMLLLVVSMAGQLIDKGHVMAVLAVVVASFSLGVHVMILLFLNKPEILARLEKKKTADSFKSC